MKVKVGIISWRDAFEQSGEIAKDSPPVQEFVTVISAGLFYEETSESYKLASDVNEDGSFRTVQVIPKSITEKVVWLDIDIPEIPRRRHRRKKSL